MHRIHMCAGLLRRVLLKSTNVKLSLFRSSSGSAVARATPRPRAGCAKGARRRAPSTRGAP